MTAPLFVPIDWAAIERALKGWFATVSGCETIWAEEGGPQPAYPYASLNILPGPGVQGALDEQRIQPDGSLKVVGRRDFILSGQINVGDQERYALANARTRADAIVASLSLPQFLDQLSAVNLGVWERGQPQTVNVNVGTLWIKRALLEIRFATTSVVDVDAWPDMASLGWFNKVVMSSNLSPLQGGGGLNWTDEVLDPSNP